MNVNHSQRETWMNTSPAIMRLPVYILFAMVLGLSSPVLGQSDGDLRRENQRLTTQLRENSRELEAAKARITELEQQVARLERALAALRGEQPPAAPTDEIVTIDESEPSASPRALLRALAADYEETMKDVEIGSGREGDRTRANYMRSLQRWQAGISRKYRAQIQWHVRVEGETATRTGYDLRLRAVDPVTKATLGDAFEISLPQAMARRYETIRDRDRGEVLVLRGTMSPRVVLNPDRHTSGPFDNPKLIGPFAEFGFSIEPRSLLAAGEDES